MTDILYQILLIVSIIVGVLLAANLIRLYITLKDVNEISRVSKKRVNDIDRLLAKFTAAAEHTPEILRSFLASLDIAKIVKKKIEKYMNKNEGGDKDE